MASRWRTGRELTWGNPPRRIQTTVAGVGLLVSLAWLGGTNGDRALGWAFAAFGVYTLLHSAFNAWVAMVADADSKQSDDLAGEIVKTNQATVLALTGTTLGVLTAFTDGRLPAATRAAVVALVGATLVQFTVQGSGARKLGLTAWRIGLVGDLIAYWLLSFGLISLAAALVSRTSP